VKNQWEHNQRMLEIEEAKAKQR